MHLSTAAEIVLRERRHIFNKTALLIERRNVTPVYAVYHNGAVTHVTTSHLRDTTDALILSGTYVT